MRRYALYMIILSFMAVLSGYSFAQQDYQIVQNFKAKQQQIEDGVKNAQSLDDLNNMQLLVNNLKSDYMGNKDLLDKSLYPDDFTTAIDKLNNQIDVRKGDFTQIGNLKDQVSQIQVQLDSLNARNAGLLAQIEQMKESNSKDAAHLAKTIAELKSSLAKRDRIIMSMLSEMLPHNAGSENSSLTGTEKQRLYSQTKKTDLIANIKKAIDENEQFLSMTSLAPSDLEQMKHQQSDFTKIWNKVGPELVSVYSSKRMNAGSRVSIDSSLSAWNNSIDQVAWNTIHQKFADKGIALNYFTNGNEFVQTITSYIDKEMNSKGEDSRASKELYTVFVDSVWSADMRQLWIPYLMNNNMLASYDNDRIEAKIESWKNQITPNNFIWVYIIGGLLVLIIGYSIIRVIAQSRKNKVSQDIAGAKLH